MGKTWARAPLLLATLAAGPLFGQTAAIGKTDAKGAITFEAFEDVLINQSRKIRLMPEDTQSLDQAAFKKLPRMDLAQAGILRRNSAGLIVRVGGKGSKPEIVLPDNLQLKAPVPGKSAQDHLAIEVVTSKKAKQRDTLPQESFFFYSASAEPDRAVYEFLHQEWLFANLDERFAAMRGFVASFPTSSSRDSLRADLDGRVAAGVVAFDDGAAFQDLLLTDRFAKEACEIFPKDQRLLELRDGVQKRIRFVEQSVALLRSLAASGYWDAFLERYPKFESYQWSFADLQTLRDRALEESARIHGERARAFIVRGNHDASIREISLARKREPNNNPLEKLMESEHLTASKIEAQSNAANRKRLVADSPEDRLFRRAIYNAKRAILDHDYPKATIHIQEAEHESPNAPDIVLLRAQLLAAQDHLTAALKLLDAYDRLVVDPTERDEGYKLRDQILYDSPVKKAAARRAADEAVAKGDYLLASRSLAPLLEIDDNDPEVLFSVGTIAAILRDSATAKRTLTRFMELSDNLAGDLKRRDRARRILTIVEEVSPKPAQGIANWMSGRKLADGVYYCPESLAFQLPVESIAGFKMRMAFDWKGGKLNNIVTTFEDEKGRAGYGALNPSAQESEVGMFYFNYLTDGSLRSVRTKKLAQPVPDGFRLVREKDVVRMVDADGHPRPVFPGNPQVNPKILGMLDSPVLTVVSGNSFFNPFIWDGVHYFSARYDEKGRLKSAAEQGADNLVTFTWDGERLTEISAYHKDSETAYYRRTISYSGTKIASEDYTSGGKSGQIKYLYNAADLEAKVEDHGVHDGRTWTVHLGSPGR